MKDFYKRLGITYGASAAHIMEAVEKHPDSTLKVAARAALLSVRRKNYDNAHCQLSQIGQLRANLGLTHTELWRESNASDFDAAARGHQSQLKVLREGVNRVPPAAPEAPEESWSRHRARRESTLGVTGSPGRAWWVTALRTLGLLVALGLWVLYLLRSQQESAQPATTETHGSLSDPTTEWVGAAEKPNAVPSGDLLDDEFPNMGSQSPLAEPAPIAQAEVPLPRTGAMFLAERPRDTWPELRIRAGESSGNFFVKILRGSTRKEVAHAFIRAGEVVSLRLPPGHYRVKYAGGTNWFGKSLLFGSRTIAAEGVDPIALRVIEVADGFELLGGELTLEKQVDGNFADQQIPIGSF